MAKISMMVKAAKPQKFAVRQYNRCGVCGRPRAYYRKFKLCRICLRNQALNGNIPGMVKSSW
ncbi:MAG: type Z 30S ribosomal protein S14 [Thermodesulfobacteriota bacterium]